MTIHSVRKAASWLTASIIAVTMTIATAILLASRVDSSNLLTSFFNQFSTLGRLGLVTAAFAATISITICLIDRINRKATT